MIKLLHVIAFAVLIQACLAEQFAFSQNNQHFTAFLEPATYLEAIKACSYTLMLDGGVGALLPASLLVGVFAQLAREQPETAQELRSGLANQVAAGAPQEQQQWALWTWDEFRVCRAAKLLPDGTGSGGSSGSSGAGPDLTLVTTDRPCSWRLAYVCTAEQAVVLAAGLSSSSAWYRRHFAPGAPEPLLPSPYAATGPVATSSDSSSGSSSQAGLTLYRSSFTAGGPLGRLWMDKSVDFPLTVEVEDGAKRFWRLGPIVTALYRGGNRRLTALRLVREGEAADSWAAYQGQSPAVGLPPPLGDEFVLGMRIPATSKGKYLTESWGPAGPGYETYNVGPYNDYIVAVEGCLRTSEVEGLTLVTRSGRRLQLGRGGCGNWFREDAPPGGYLAGAWSQFLNDTAWDRYQRLAGLTPGSAIQLPYLLQLSLIWAAPASAPLPSTAVHYAPVLDTWSQPPACPWASGMAGRFFPGGIQACTGALYGREWKFRICSSNTCCNFVTDWLSGAGVYSYCSTTLNACQSNCALSAGLCWVVPEALTLHFLAAATLNQSPTHGLQPAAAPAAAPAATATTTAGPTTTALTSYIINRVDLMSYADAVQFCARSSYMGLDWEMVRVQDVFDWVASSWTRRGAHEAVSALGYFWVAPSSSDAAQPSAAAGASCTRVAFGLPDGLDSPSATDSHTLAVGDCTLLAAVVCRAVARPLSASATAAATAAAALEAPDAAADGSTTTTTSSSSSLALVNVSSTYPPAAAVLGGASSLADRGLISPAAAAAAWVPGPHTLLTASSRRLGNGPYIQVNASAISGCNAAIGGNSATESISNSTLQNSTSVSRSSTVVDLQQPVTAISVSVAVQLTNETDSVAVLSAVRLRLGIGSSWQHMGLVSSGGWETFQLAPGEVVVAVSGCTGGFVERLVFHTNAGRRWTHALLGAAAACSVPFLDSVPQPGGYLVGMQGSVGYYIGSLQIVWGMPAGATSGPVLTGNSSLGSSDTTADAKQPGQSGSLGSLPAGMTGGPPVQASAAPVLGATDTTTSGSSSSAPIGVIAGAVVGGVAVAVAVGAAAMLMARRRRQQAKWWAGCSGCHSGDGKADSLTGCDSSSHYYRDLVESAFDTMPASCSTALATTSAPAGKPHGGGGTATRPSAVVALTLTAKMDQFPRHRHLIIGRPSSSSALNSSENSLSANVIQRGRQSIPPLVAAGSSPSQRLDTAPAAGGSEESPAGAAAAGADPGVAVIDEAGGAAGPACGLASPVPHYYWAGAAAAAAAAAVAVTAVPLPPPPLLPVAVACARAQQAPQPAGAAAPLLRWTAMQPDDVMSQLSAYISMRMEESLAWNLPHTTTAAAAAGAPGGHGTHCSAGRGPADPTTSPPPVAAASDPAAAGSQTAATNGRDQPEDIGAAISEAQAALAGRQGGAWQGLRIQTVLGRGAFGIVYLGTWRNLRVAIKTLVVHDALAGGQARQRHRAIIEAAISKSLQHPNVVTTYEAEVVPLAVVPAAVGVADTAAAGLSPPHQDQDQDRQAPPGGGDAEGDVYKLLIIQEYCDVGSLSAAFDAGVFKSSTGRGPGLLCGLTLALDVACGMRHIHSRNIVHGDLSAGNVLLSSVAGFDWEKPKTQTGELVQSARGGADARTAVAGGAATGARAVAPASAAPTATEAAASAPAAATEGDAQLLQPLAGLWRPPVTAKVSDFGLSLPMGENQTHASNRFQGTPGYAAPEVRSRGRLSLAADVWSFGVLLLELCHGMRYKRIVALQQAEAGGVSEAPAATSHVAGAHAGDREPGVGGASTSGGTDGAPPWAVLPPSCPPQLTALVRSCLSLSPAARPTFDQIVAQLAALLGESRACGSTADAAAASSR